MSHKSQKLVKIERLLREHVREILLKEAPGEKFGIPYGKEGFPQYPGDPFYYPEYNAQNIGAGLTTISNALGVLSEYFIKISTFPIKARATNAIELIDRVLNYTQSVTPKVEHIIPNLGEIDWSKAFFGNKEAISPIFYWYPASSAWGVAKLSGKLLPYEDAIKLGARDISTISDLHSKVLYDLRSKQSLDQGSAAIQQLILSSNSQAEIEKQSAITNKSLYYYVAITQDNKNLRAIKTSLRQQDFKRTVLGFPEFDSNGDPVVVDSAVETRVTEDVYSLPNMTKFCIESLRILSVAPESYIGKQVAKLPPKDRETYLTVLRGLLVGLSVISNIPGFQATKLGAVATGLLISSTLAEASISFTQGNYGQGVMSLIGTAIISYSGASIIEDIISRESTIFEISSQITGQAANTSKQSRSFKDLLEAVKNIQSAGLNVIEESGEYFLVNSATSSADDLIKFKVDQQWFDFFNSAGTGRSVFKTYIEWYNSTTSWLRSMAATAFFAGIDIKFADSTIKEFQDSFSSSLPEVSSKPLPPLSNSREVRLGLSINKLFQTSFASMIDANGDAKTKSITFVNMNTGDYIEGISQNALNGVTILKDIKTDGQKVTELLGASDSTSAKLIVASDEVYNSVSSIIKTYPGRVFSSVAIKLVPLNNNKPYAWFKLIKLN
jgi:hypothetical protein